MNTLYVSCSPSMENSSSRTIANAVLEKLNPDASEVSIVKRDVASQPIPHWSGRQIQAAFTPISARSEEDKHVLQFSDALCDELLKSDTVVVSTPMWNYGIPSTLKAWIDHIVRAGVTFRYTDAGPIGLLTHIKNVIIIESTGGIYPTAASAGTGSGTKNHVAPYLKDLFEFLGVQKVSILSIQGTAINLENALVNARQELARLSF